MGEWGATLVVLGEVAILRPDRGRTMQGWISLREASPGDNLSTVALEQRDYSLEGAIMPDGSKHP
jgi:hypothetical protein